MDLVIHGLTPGGTNVWLEGLKAFVGLGGFAGVILTLRSSARAAAKAEIKDRERRDQELADRAEERRELERQRADERQEVERRRSAERDDEIKTLKVALLSSLIALAKMIDDELDFIGARGTNGTWLPLFDFFETYRANLSKIGLLDDESAAKITTAYFAYAEYAGYAARRGKVVGDRIPGGLVELDGASFKQFKGEIVGFLKDMRRPVADAIVALAADKGGSPS